jgi:hypothetical protein
MAACSFDTLYRDRFGQIGVNFRRDLVVGTDSPLIRLRLKHGARRMGMVLPSPDEVTLNEMIALGIAGNAHLIDVSAYNPESYRFEYYGVRSLVCDRKNFQGKQVGDAKWLALHDFGASDYSRIKERAEPDVVDVSYTRRNCRTSYRRLSLPMSRNGRDVTHLLVAMVMHEMEVPLGAEHQVAPRILRREDTFVPSGRPEMTVDQ